MNTTEFKMFLYHLIERLEKGEIQLRDMEVSSPIHDGEPIGDGTHKKIQPEIFIHIQLHNLKQ